MKKSKVRLLVPCFNEQLGIDSFHNDLGKKLDNINGVDFHILYINDGSTDSTLDSIRLICRRDPRAKLISFSRNFGKEIALSAGLHQSIDYDAVIMLDADGQHPPSTIAEFIKSWRDGYEVVIGTRTHTEHKKLLRRVGTVLFNTVLTLISGQGQGDARMTDFRLLDRKVVEAFSTLGEHNRITRGLIDWLGFKRCYVDFKAPRREHGEPTYNNKMLARLAMHAFVSHSTRPLKLIGALGITVTLLSLLSELTLVLYMYIFNDPYSLRISGTFHAGMLIIFMVGILLTCQGLIALYIENIYVEARARPLYIISESTT